MTDPLSTFKRARDLLGGTGKTASALGVTGDAVRKAASGSGTIAAEELVPRVRWARMPDATWPAPAGRPVVLHDELVCRSREALGVLLAAVA
jgi:hypothetical protein